MNAVWSALAGLLDALGRLSALALLGLAAVLAAVVLLQAWLLQRTLVRALLADPATTVRWWRLELRSGLLWAPIDLLIRGVGRLAVLMGGWVRKKGKAQAGQPEPKAEIPLVVATLGPTFLVAGIATAVLYLFARLGEPLLAARMGLPGGSPAWQILLLGHRPEMGLFLPLDRHAARAAALVAAIFWTTVGWWVARVVRVVWQGTLGRNLADQRDDSSILPFWRRKAGVTGLVRPDPSYAGWAAWVVAAGVPFLVWAWLSLEGEPFRVRPSEAAMAFVLLLFWAIHLLLRGLDRAPVREKPDSEAEETQANGWSEVLGYLKDRLQVAPPLQVQPARAVEPLQFTQLPAEMGGVISPLVLDLLPSGRLTVMQRLVLTDLSLQSFVHMEPPASQETLELTALAGEPLQDRSRLRHRNQIVVAPESAGKTTLGLLAAANHVLVHTRSALLIARDDAHEERLHRRIGEVLEPSATRWNLRVRRVGGDLMNDLTRGIVPDVVVCSLPRLVAHLLGNAEGFAPFLRTLGLIVVDDVESFCGPVEVHAQLAFRRLAARLRQLQGVGALGERGAPLVLVLGADSFHDLSAWAKTLCGMDAVTRDFTRGAEEAEEREAAEGAARGVAAQPDEAKPAGNLQVSHRLRDFRTASGELLSAAALVQVCEHLSVPWIYRPCGDLRRHLGRRPLLLKDEPRWCVDSPEDACVIFLEGHWSDVRRERRRLRRAGARFRRRRAEGEEAPQGNAEDAAGEVVAFISLADADEEMAFTQLDRRFGLAEILERLPEPALRPPSGRVTFSHLAADLVQHWMEVAEVVHVFGQASAPVLRQLARGGLLLTEPRVDVHPDAYEYVRKVYVRALARATAPRLGDLTVPPVLPMPVAEVELVSPRSVAVRDRTKPATPLARVDASASAFLYYPGRIFADARGSFLVVGRVLTDDGEGSALEAGDVLVEPVLTDDVSSPRRRVESRFDPGSASLDMETVPPEPVLFGRHAIRVGVLPVEVRPRHRATLRLGPVHGEVRQRLVREETAALPLQTVGLWIEPDPDLGTVGAGEAPRLTFGAARLIAAAFRAILPSMVRGAAESLEVTLRVDGDPAPLAPETGLRPGEGFLVFDLDQGGSGTSRSLLRDGVEPLLRLCRLLLERILDPSRLLALHDHWADPLELIEGAEEAADPRAAVERHAELRRQALIWLDSRLRPEGRAEGVPGATGQAEGDFQPGEGDAIDLGRCWFSVDGSVNDLVWAKHRWRIPGGGEAMLDVAFDRILVAASRDFANRAPFLEAYRVFHATVLTLPERRLADGTVWGAPRAVLLEKEGKAVLGEEGLQAGAIASYHPLAEAIAAYSEDILCVLAGTLKRASGGAGPGDAAGRLALLRYLSGFVQGIPYSIPDALRDGLRPPVSTLLYRLGDCDSKSLLLALLARSCGVDAGLFVSFPEGHALAAVAAPDSWSGAGGESSERPIPPPLLDWCGLAGLSGPPRLWAEMPESTDSGSGVRIYVPIESTVYFPVGHAPVALPRTWAFLPLTVAPLGLPAEGSGVERKDTAELEDRA
jgi:hypothetical protein